MADGRDVRVWDNHAQECREANRTLFEFDIPDKATDDWLKASMGGWLRHQVLTLLSEGAKCLDLGCGPGYWRNLFASMQYTGFDQSTEMLKLAAEIPSEKVDVVEWVQGNARQVNNHFDTAVFDMVFTASVLQHNRTFPDKTEILEGIKKILKPGGYLLLTENTFREDNCPQSVGRPGYTDGYSFTPEGWQTYLEGLGFEFIAYNGKSEYVFRLV